MNIDPDDAALEQALAEHSIPVEAPPLGPAGEERRPEGSNVPPEKPENKLNLALNPDEFVMDVPPREGI